MLSQANILGQIHTPHYILGQIPTPHFILGQIPTSGLGQIPTPKIILGQIPTSGLGQIPTSVLGQIPTSVWVIFRVPIYIYIQSTSGNSNPQGKSKSVRDSEYSS